jgi:hypothetical protein
MRLKLAGSALALLSLAVAAAPVAAQLNRGLELGMDAGFFHYMYSYSNGTGPSSSNVLAFPVSEVRLAFPSSGPFEIETAANFGYSSAAGRSQTSVSADGGLLVELSHDPKASQWFLRPALGLDHFSSGGSGTNSTSDRYRISAGIGNRMPLTDRISARYELRYSYMPKYGNTTSNAIGLLAGISVFTR